jgi:hypothetical protein
LPTQTLSAVSANVTAERLDFTDGIAFLDARDETRRSYPRRFTSRRANLIVRRWQNAPAAPGALPENTALSPRGDLIEAQRHRQRRRAGWKSSMSAANST